MRNVFLCLMGSAVFICSRFYLKVAIKMMIFYELKKQLDIRFHFLTLFSLGAIAMSRM